MFDLLVALAIGGGTILHWVAYLLNLRFLIAQNRRRHFEIIPCSPDDVPGLNEAALQGATREVQELGFEWLEDHAVRPVQTRAGEPPPIADPLAPSFVPDKLRLNSLGRILVHREHGCLAKIMAIMIFKAADGSVADTSFSVALVSTARLGNQAWHYSTSNRVANATNDALMMITRSPQYLTTRMPNAPVSQLLRVHLARRADIARVAGLRWKRDVSLADDYASEESAVENLRRVYARLNPFSMAWLIFKNKRAPLSSRLEWLGELRGQIPPP